MLLLVGISAGIAGVATHILWDRYDAFVLYFFHELPMQEQVALMALFFAMMLASVGMLQSLLDSSSNSNKSTGSSFASIPSSHTIHITRSPTTTTNNNNNNNKSPVKIAYPLHEMNQALSDRAKFECLFPWLRDSILDHMRQDHQVAADEQVLAYLTKMMNYTVMGGTFNRGTTVLSVYKAIHGSNNTNSNANKSKSTTLSPYEMAQAITLGWTIELLQAFFLVADDVMDESQSRRGQPCWYQLPNVQLKAINDAFLLESFLFSIVKLHFSHLPCYTQILELLLEVIQKTELGQLFDLTSQQAVQAKGDSLAQWFTPQRYRLIVRYKTAYYSFYLPVALAMALAGIRDQAAFDRAKEICGILGEYFQVQDDCKDWIGGDPQPGGKTGSYIQDNKCSWLIVQALVEASDEQRTVLEDNYGHDDEESVEKVKQIYKDLQLHQAFSTYQEESFRQIQALIAKVEGMPKEVFHVLVKKVYKRMRK